jgi:predicted nucleic acid-binding protein
MKTRRLYLDTCVLVGFYDNQDHYNQEIIKFFKRISEDVKSKKIKLYCSIFSIVEFTKIMIDSPHISHIPRATMLNYRDEMLNFEKIGEYPITIINLEKWYGEAKEAFKEFFLRDLQNVWLDVKDPQKNPPHLADAIHATIMKKRKITEIVTFDTNHFDNIKDVKPILPKDV